MKPLSRQAASQLQIPGTGFIAAVALLAGAAARRIEYFGGIPRDHHQSPREEERAMAKGDSAVYRVTEVIGTSANSWEDAARNAIKTASKSLRDLRIAELTKFDVKIEDGKVTQFRARLSLSFKYDA